MSVTNTNRYQTGENKGKLKPKHLRRPKPWRCNYFDPMQGGRRDLFFATRKEADDHDALFKTQNNTGTFVNQEKGKKFVREYAPTWMKNLAVKAETLTKYEGIFRLHILPHLGHLKVNAVQRGDIQGWVKAMIDEGWSAKSIRMWYALLAAMFKNAWTDRAIGMTPCVKIQLPVVERPDKWLPSPRQVVALHRAIEPRFALAILIAAGCGLRWGEVMGLEWDDFDFTNGVIKVRRKLGRSTGAKCRHFTKPKTVKSKRDIDMPAQVVQAARLHRAAGYTRTLECVDFTVKRKAGTKPEPRMMELMFSQENGRLLYNSGWTKIMRTGIAAAGEVLADAPPEFTLHNLRHYFASLLINAGASVREVQEAMGHSDPMTTYREYTWPTSEGRGRAMIEAAFAAGEDELAAADEPGAAA